MTGKAGRGSKVSISQTEGDAEIADENYEPQKLCLLLHAKSDIKAPAYIIHIIGLFAK